MWSLGYILLAVLLTSICLAAPQQPQEDLLGSIPAGIPVNYPNSWEHLENAGKPNFPSNDFSTNSPNSWEQSQNPNVQNFSEDNYERIVGELFVRPNVSSTDFPSISPSTGNPIPQGECECVHYYQCTRNGTHNLFGDDVIDERGGFCGSLMVCCSLPNKVPIDSVMPDPILDTEQKRCGRRNLKGIGGRIGDFKNQEAQFGEFPWMVAILALEPRRKMREPINVYQCGGSLIHPQIVLTAAHCLKSYENDPSIITIRAGEWDTQTTNEILPHQDRKVRNVILHENYNSGTLANDFALIILDQPVDFRNEHVGSVCLPETNDDIDFSQRCIASGWGRDSYGREGDYQNILKRIDLPMVRHDQCQKAYRTTRLGVNYELHNSFTCAGGEAGKDTCQGDGGSALVCPMKDDPFKYVQAGIVSWGIGCGEDGIPGIYADVVHARKWIDQIVTQAGFNINEYQTR